MDWEDDVVEEFITMGDFLQIADDKYDVRVRDIDTSLNLSARILIRPRRGSAPVWTPCPKVEDDEELFAVEIGYLCRHLGMSPMHFNQMVVHTEDLELTERRRRRRVS
ncbi:hypothetical protein [Nannocystis pusilla]|uniref:hypothetical protein n=1 Tax=Nannocystis pusilla TaxID=889268 RepID=UPI003B819939